MVKSFFQAFHAKFFFRRPEVLLKNCISHYQLMNQLVMVIWCLPVVFTFIFTEPGAHHKVHPCMFEKIIETSRNIMKQKYLTKSFCNTGKNLARVGLDFDQNSIRILRTLTRTSQAPVSYQTSSRSRKELEFTHRPCNKFLDLDQSRTSTNLCQIGSQIWQKSRPRHLAQFKTSGELVSNQ